MKFITLKLIMLVDIIHEFLNVYLYILWLIEQFSRAKPFCLGIQLRSNTNFKVSWSIPIYFTKKNNIIVFANFQPTEDREYYGWYHRLFFRIVIDYSAKIFNVTIHKPLSKIKTFYLNLGWVSSFEKWWRIKAIIYFNSLRV